LTSFLPQLGQVSLMVASLFLSLCSTVWTADRFARRREGNDEAFVLVITVFEDVSENYQQDFLVSLVAGHPPLFSAPQQSQTNTVFTSPVELSNKLPQSVQNTNDPIADMLSIITRV
jgi:hypothetical protein